MRKPLVAASVAVLMALGTAGFLSATQSATAVESTQADKPSFQYAGKGNFVAVGAENGKIHLVSVPYSDPNFNGPEDEAYTLDFFTKQKDKQSVQAKQVNYHAHDRARNPKQNKLDMKIAHGKIVPVIKGKQASVAPNGVEVAFADEHMSGIFVTDKNGNVREITKAHYPGVDGKKLAQDDNPEHYEKWNLFWAAEPLWSQQGDKLSYLSNRTDISESAGLSVWVTDKSGGNDRLLLDAKDHGDMGVLQWTPDNNLIVQKWDRNTISLADLNGQVTDLVQNAVAVSASPDGQYVVYRENRDGQLLPTLHVLNLNTKETTEITGIPAGFQDNFLFDWNPAGQKLAFLIYSREGNRDDVAYTTNTKLAIFNAASGKTRIIESPNEESFLLGSALSWGTDNHVVANLANGFSVVMEVK